MKKLLFILAFAGILFQAFSTAIILLSFEVNRDFISENLCIKKAEVNNCCKGSCHLQKELKEDCQKDRSAPLETLKVKVEVSLICEIASLQNLVQTSSIITFENYHFSIPSSPRISIFHPPCV